MKLIVKCKNCREENDSPVKGDTRIDIVKKYGVEFDMVCSSCNKRNKYEADDVRAEDYSLGEIVKNRIAIFLIILVIVFVLGSYLIGTLAAVIILVISAVRSMNLMKKNSSEKNLTFNKHKVKGRRSNVGG